MRKRKGFLILALLCMAMLVAACGQESGSADPAANQVSEQETPAVKVVDKGSIIQKEGSRWLITAYVEKKRRPLYRCLLVYRKRADGAPEQRRP